MTILPSHRTAAVGLAPIATACASRFLRRAAVATCLAGLLVALAPPRNAKATIETASTSIANCVYIGGTATSCTDTGYLSDTLAGAGTTFIGESFPIGDPTLSDFSDAFNNWNAANGNEWTLVDGGVLSGVNLDVNASLAIGAGGGGLSDVIVTLSGSPTAGEPSLNQLVWTQALFTDYTPTEGTVDTPVLTLDTYSLSAGSPGSGGAFTSACVPIPGQNPGADNTAPAVIGAVPTGEAYCDPIYPFQYASTHNGQSLDGVTLSTDFFFDAPQAGWLDDAFRGISLLSTVTFDTDANGDITNRILTVYDGVSYGFTLSADPVPEPATTGLLLGPLAILFLLARRRAGEVHRS